MTKPPDWLSVGPMEIFKDLPPVLFEYDPEILSVQDEIVYKYEPATDRRHDGGRLMTQYNDGRRFEYRVRDALREDGYEVLRSAGSKTKIDLVAIKRGQQIFIQCKLNGLCAPAERSRLRDLAGMVGALPVVAYSHKEGRAAATVRYRLLTGDGPKSFVDWHSDILGQPHVLDAVDGRVHSAMLLGLQDADLSGVGGTERIGQWAEWIAEQYRDAVAGPMAEAWPKLSERLDAAEPGAAVTVSGPRRMDDEADWCVAW